MYRVTYPTVRCSSTLHSLSYSASDPSRTTLCIIDDALDILRLMMTLIGVQVNGRCLRSTPCFELRIAVNELIDRIEHDAAETWKQGPARG
jgi:hypothetical protein